MFWSPLASTAQKDKKDQTSTLIDLNGKPKPDSSSINTLVVILCPVEMNGLRTADRVGQSETIERWTNTSLDLVFPHDTLPRIKM